MQEKTVIFMGAQGSGKGTQAELFAKHLRQQSDVPVVRVETGRHFREISEGESASARRVRETIGRGNMLPDAFAVWAWIEQMMEGMREPAHVIMDGFPRSLAQARLLEETLAFYGRERVDVIDFEISHEIARERLKGRGRGDDTEESIDRRLAFYEETTRKVLDFFESEDRYTVMRIDAEQSIEAIHGDVVKHLS